MLKKTLPLLLLGACALAPATPESYLAAHGLPAATLRNFPHCYNYGCDKVADVSLNAQEWSAIDALFSPPSRNAEDERAQIAKAVGLFERIVGAKTGTQADIHGTFGHIGPFQQDCIDESTNTTVYLSLLAQRHLLRFHNASAPDTRSPLFLSGRWPHRTAVIVENDSHTPYAVDSWFHDNGSDAEVLPLALWKDGWKPEQNLQRGRDFPPAP